MAKHLGVRPELAALEVAIDSVKPWPGNPRRGDIALIRESLRQTGQYKPILVQQSSKQIMAGNQTWLAAKEEGWKKIAVQVLDVDNRTAERILLVDNRANDRGEYDNEELLALLNEQTDLVGTGYSLDDLEDLRARIDTLAWDPAHWFNNNEPIAQHAGGAEEGERGEWIRPEGSRAGMMREMVLLLTTDESEEIRDHLAALAVEYGTPTTKDTIIEAVRREASALN